MIIADYLWNQNASESHLPVNHFLQGIVGLVQWEFLNHDIDIVHPCKVNRFLAVEGMTTWPGHKTQPVLNHGGCVDFDWSGSS